MAICTSLVFFLQFPDDNIRVIFINANSDVARVVLCEVSTKINDHKIFNN